MAGIDKTYTSKWSEYIEFRTWAKKNYVTFFNGKKDCVGNYLYEWEEEDFNGKYELPIANTPNYIDIYLVQNCPCKFVIDRMKDVYSKTTLKEYKSVDLTAELPETHKQNRKIVITRNKNTKSPLHKRPYRVNGRYYSWWLTSDDDFDYDTDTNVWVDFNVMHYPYSTNVAYANTLKGVVRMLRKQYLPIGAKFTLSGKYVGETYTINIK